MAGSRVLSVRLLDETLCQAMDVLEGAGVAVQNMPLSTVARLVVEGVCRRALNRGVTNSYSDEDVAARLNYQPTPEFDMDTAPSTEPPYQWPGTRPGSINPEDYRQQHLQQPFEDKVTAADKRALVEEQMQPFIDEAKKKIDEARFKQIISKPDTDDNEQKPPTEDVCGAPWEDVVMIPRHAVDQLKTVSPFTFNALEKDDTLGILAVMITVPRLPDGILGGPTGERLFVSVKEELHKFCEAHNVEPPDLYNIA